MNMQLQFDLSYIILEMHETIRLGTFNILNDNYCFTYAKECNPNDGEKSYV